MNNETWVTQALLRFFEFLQFIVKIKQPTYIDITRYACLDIKITFEKMLTEEQHSETGKNRVWIAFSHLWYTFVWTWFIAGLLNLKQYFSLNEAIVNVKWTFCC